MAARAAAFLRSRLVRSVFKGVLAYTIAFVLIFAHPFSRTVKYPVVLSSIILVSIAGSPGRNVGSVLDAGFWGMLGVAVGGLAFYALASLANAPVAQGFLFLVVVYGFAFVKSKSMRYFGFSLLGIIMSFSGIYTSVLLKTFAPEYLTSYLISYAWGFALVLVVNVLVFPVSAERELREALVSSLERISTLAHLIAKTYTLEISDEERKVRDSLHQSIRADFALLSQRQSETSVELNWTRWSLSDYARMTNHIRAAQQGLITSYSSLTVIERYEPEALKVVKSQLLGTSRVFQRLRHGADLLVRDIVTELAVGKDKADAYHSPVAGSRSWEEFIDDGELRRDTEAADGRPRATSSASAAYAEDVQHRLARVTSQLASEVEHLSPRPSLEGSTAAGSPLPVKVDTLDRSAFIRSAWSEFETEQNAAIVALLEQGLAGDDVLLLDSVQPSLQDQYSSVPLPPAVLRQKSSSSEKRSIHSGEASKDGDAVSHADQICSAGVMRVFSFLHGMRSVAEELSALHELIVPSASSPPRPKRLHLHFFESIPKTNKVQMSLQEALASLEGREFVAPRVPFSRRFAQLEQMVKSTSSADAFKTAVAVSVFTVFILAPSLSAFFVEYSLTGGLITLVVSMAPTLGQTLFTFVLQVSGTGLGSLYGMTILYIFRYAGGYFYNPYGISCLVALFAVPLCWIIYSYPIYFAFALLALNGAGTIIVTEYVYGDVPGQIRPGFDSPALRCGKALVSMSIALVIAGFFQAFILRTPSRHTLRLKLSEITFALGSYNILFQALTAAVAPLDEDKSPRTPQQHSAVQRVYSDLVRREAQIQLDILSLFPLMKFSAVEFDFGKPFEAAIIGRLIRTHQICLDRLREARSAVGMEGFNEGVHTRFTTILAPYRRQAKRYSRALFYLAASSLATKTPLPVELPSMAALGRGLQHDALVISHRLTRDADGRKLLASDGFLRYWFFLSSYTSVGYQLEQMEEDLRLLFADEEDKHA